MSDQPTVHAAFTAVMADVQAIRKAERNNVQNFNFRGIDAVMNAVGPALRKHGVVIVPTAESVDQERYNTAKGGLMHGVVVKMSYTVYGPAGDHFTGGAYGQAADSGDKAVSKAESVAYRTFLLQALTIPTDEPDPDLSVHERVNPQPSEADKARGALLETMKFKKLDPTLAVERFAADGHGDLRTSGDEKAIRALTDFYRSMPDEKVAS